MPAGTWHTTAEQEEESLSLVVVVRAPSRLDLLLNLLDYYAGQSPLWRARPYGAWANDAGAEAEHQVFDELVAELGERMSGLRSRYALGAWDTHGYTVGTLSEYPRGRRYERFIRLPNSSARFEPGDTPGKLRCVVLSGPINRPQTKMELVFDAAALPVFDWVLGLRRGFTLGEASAKFGEFTEQELCDLFARLAQAALIRPLPAPEWDEP
jgi:hypothetical protein